MEKLFKDWVSIEEPHDDTIIWHYMDMLKFLSLLQEKKIYFSKLDCLEDKYEGKDISFAKSYKEIQRIKEIVSKNNIDVKSLDPQIEDLIHRYDIYKDCHKTFNEIRFISCWHMSNDESVLMWKYYAGNNSSIAIQSTFKKLKESLIKSNKEIDNKFIFGKVVYKSAEDKQNLHNAYIKRKCFKDENELRIMYIDRDNRINGKGTKFNIDINLLIESIVISPTTEEWQVVVIRNVIKQYFDGNGIKFDAETSVRKSDILDEYLTE